MEIEDNILLICESNEETLKQMRSDIQQKLELDPDNMILILQRCLILILLKDEEEASLIFRKSQLSRVKDTLGTIVHSKLKVLNDEIQEAYDLLNKALIDMPFNLSILLALKKVAIKMENQELLSKYNKKFIAAYEFNKIIFNSVTSNLLKHKQYEEVINIINYAVLMAYESSQLNLKKAACLFNCQRYEEALVFYQKVLDDEPENIDLNYNLTRCLKKLYRIEEAIAIYQKITDLDKSQVESQVETALCFIQINKFDEAIRILNEVLKRDPLHGKAYEILSDTYISLERYLEAGQVLVKGTLNRPDNVNLYLILTKLYGKQKMDVLAQRYLEVALEMDQQYVIDFVNN